MSAIRLALDQGIPVDAATLLKKAGYECTHVSEVGMSRAEDAEILSWARKLDSVIVTLDSVFTPCWRSPGRKRRSYTSS